MEIKIISTPKAPIPAGPYSQAILSGNLLFISGQLGINPDDGKLQTDIQNQTRQAMENMKNILKSENLTFKNIVKTTIFITSMSHFQEVNKIYAHYFEEHKPARSTIEVSALPLNGLVEIEAIATIK